MERQDNDEAYPLQKEEMGVNYPFSACISSMLQGLPSNAETEMAFLPVAPAASMFSEKVCKRQQSIQLLMKCQQVQLSSPK